MNRDVDRWHDARVELLVDGVVVAQADRLGVFTGDESRFAMLLDDLDRTYLRPHHGETGSGVVSFGLEVGKRQIATVGSYEHDSRLVIIDIASVDECWIGGRLIRPRVPAGASSPS